MGMNLMSGMSRRLEKLGRLHNLIVPRLVPIDQVHLVHADHHVLDAQEVGDEAVPVRLLEHPARASMRMMARSAVEAPVTMLRVYWM